jgi:3-hydroxybutyryl-CoA dehydratase
MMFSETLKEVRFHVDKAAIGRYAAITQDFNPIHLDAEFASKTPMGGIIAHGTMSMSLIWQSLSETCKLDDDDDVILDIRFVRPVRENDWVVAGGTLTDARGIYDVWVRAESPSRQELVISGTATLGAAGEGNELSTRVESGP